MTDTDTPEDAPQTNAGTITFTSFLMDSHPLITKSVSNLWYSDGHTPRLNRPIIRLFCADEHCRGIRNFRCDKEVGLYGNNPHHAGVTYICSDCQRQFKFFSLHIIARENNSGEVTKFGELPPFGPPVPNQLLRLFGGDSGLFLKGRSCENQALGIAAFAYYRRVVESHKAQLFDEIIKVCKLLGHSDDFIKELEEARSLISFSQSIDHIKAALPDALLINGHNPLSLLHSALSRGLHEETDQDCLELAHSIRVVLVELVERLTQLRKEDRELTDAVKRLMKSEE
jgi:hypothetical protein